MNRRDFSNEADGLMDTLIANMIGLMKNFIIEEVDAYCIEMMQNYLNEKTEYDKDEEYVYDTFSKDVISKFFNKMTYGEMFDSIQKSFIFDCAISEVK